MNRGFGGLMSQVLIWGENHLHSCSASLGRLVRRPWATLLTVAVMALSMVLPLALSSFLENLHVLAGSVQQSRDMNVVLHVHVPPATVEQLRTQLLGWHDIAQVQVRTPEQGLAELGARIPLDGVVAVLGENPLPALLIVTPASAAKDDQLAQHLRGLPNVDRVQYDSLWQKRLERWFWVGQRITHLLWAVFGSGVVLVVGNTVRLDIQARREEIYILQLLGASKGFIRRPFVYLGAWYGVVAGGLVLAVLALMNMALQQPVELLAHSYGSHFTLLGFSRMYGVAVLMTGLLLGWLGSWIVTGYFFRLTRTTQATRRVL